jgi:hypothetical protein
MCFARGRKDVVTVRSGRRGAIAFADERVRDIPNPEILKQRVHAKYAKYTE